MVEIGNAGKMRMRMVVREWVVDEEEDISEGEALVIERMNVKASKNVG